MDRSVKLLLTLLALLTGLSAAPAEARIRSADVADLERVEDSLGGQASTAAAVAADRAGCAVQRQLREREAAPSSYAPATVVIPSIRYGDRARE
jgi:hypothetical protein